MGNYESVRNIYLDVLVQQKNARVGENYSDMTEFRFATGLETMVTESYESISDYYQQNFSKAEQGEDETYTSFQRLDDTTIGGTTAYHFTYERPGPGPGEPLQTEGGTDLIYERYGEQYLFETEGYLYAFALSEQGENPLASKLLQKMVDSIEIKTTGILEPPVNDYDDFIEFPSDAVGTPPERYTSGS